MPSHDINVRYMTKVAYANLWDSAGCSADIYL